MFNVSSITKTSEGSLAKNIKDFRTTAVANDLFLNNNSKSNVQVLKASSLEDNQIEEFTMDIDNTVNNVETETQITSVPDYGTEEYDALLDEIQDQLMPADQAIVDAVIRGDYGNGQERKDKLFELGYDPQDVQQAVNDALGIDVQADEYRPTPGTKVPHIESIQTDEKSTDIDPRYTQKEDQIEPEPPRNNPDNGSGNGNGYGPRPETK